MANPLDLEGVYDEEVSRLVPEAVLTPNQVLDKTVTAAAANVPASTRATVNIQLADFGKELLARETGLAIRAELATLLADGSRIVINLDGVEDITPSVADECFGKLAERLGLSKFRHRIEFSGGTTLMHRLIDFVLAQRSGPKAR
jgi:hypothetical protein